MDIARSNFTRQKSRFDVVKKMIELGISVRNDEKLMIKDVHISDTALAKSINVDRRVVRDTVKQILANNDLKKIFNKIQPVGTSLVEIANLLGYSVLIISANPYEPGVISDVSNALARNGLVIRQALADDPNTIDSAKLTLVIEGKVPSDIITKLRSLSCVDGITLK